MPRGCPRPTSVQLAALRPGCQADRHHWVAANAPNMTRGARMNGSPPSCVGVSSRESSLMVISRRPKSNSPHSIRSRSAPDSAPRHGAAQDVGFITSSRGRRAVIVRPSELLESPSATDAAGVLPNGLHQENGDNESAMTAPQLWVITVRGPDGFRYPAGMCVRTSTGPTRSGRICSRSPGWNALWRPIVARTGSVITNLRSVSLGKSTRIRSSRCAGSHGDRRIVCRMPSRCLTTCMEKSCADSVQRVELSRGARFSRAIPEEC